MQPQTGLTCLAFADYAIQLDAADNVAVVVREIPVGRSIIAADGSQIGVHEIISPGHKFAIRRIQTGENVLRYGQVIGQAIQTIEPGAWVHTHNLRVRESKRDFEIQTSVPVLPIPTGSFQGYPRGKGLFGTRNYIAVVSTVSCSAQCTRAIAAAFTPDMLAAYPNVDGVVAVTHTVGCCAPPDSTSFAYLRRTLENILRHPNIGAAIYVSLGCEGNQMETVVPANWHYAVEPGTCLIGPYLTIQSRGGVGPTVQAGIEAVRELLPRVNVIERVQAPLSALTLAVQCGGSDGWSGVTANPLVGKVADRIVAYGGTVVLAETPEIYGAEQLLLKRTVSQRVGEKLIEKIRAWEQRAELEGFSLDNNPSPGNKKGGLTTIYEKSLGAVAKGGSTALMDVYDYAAWVESKGLVFMDTPGYDPVSVTGQIAGGCNLVLFTTGRGSVFGGLMAPCLKIASNSELYHRMAVDMDYDAGKMLHGFPLATAAEELFDQAVAVASGQRSKSEQIPFRDMDFVPWQLGPTL
jgi:altronate dehydratase